ncbi:hypothetical protein ACI2LF_43680 [Kribbella sp. NPDC020789]
MARVKGLGDALKPHTEVPADPPAEDQPPATAPAETAPAAAEPVDQVDDEPTPPAEAPEPPPAPVKKSAPAKAAASAPRGGTGARAGQSGNKPPAPPAIEIEVLATDTSSGKKVTIYLHPDDYRELMLAKVEDGADFNARMRSLIAVWRHDPRFRKKVDKLAATAPRGGMR